jgi:hypothetical protein
MRDLFFTACNWLDHYQPSLFVSVSVIVALTIWLVYYCGACLRAAEKEYAPDGYRDPALPRLQSPAAVARTADPRRTDDHAVAARVDGLRDPARQAPARIAESAARAYAATEGAAEVRVIDFDRRRGPVF